MYSPPLSGAVPGLCLGLLLSIAPGPAPASAQDKTEIPPAPLSSPSMIVSVHVPSWDVNMGSGTDGNYGDMPVDSIDFSTMTHFVSFAAALAADGGSIKWNNLVSSRRKPLNDIVHAHGKPVLLCIGGWGSDTYLSSALSPANRAATVRTILSTVRTFGYDGIDWDWEPFSTSDSACLFPTIRAIHDSFRTMKAAWDPTRHPIQTADINPGGGSGAANVWKAIAPWMEFVMIMSYDKIGDWTEMVYYDYAPYSRIDNVVVDRIPGGGQELATAQRQALQMTGAGFPPAKVVVGIDFMAGMASGGSGTPAGGATWPRQRWSTPPSFEADYKFDEFYQDILDTASAAIRHWDDTSKVYFVSIDKPGSADDRFIGYAGGPGEDRTLYYHIKLARDLGIGGIMIWDLSETYLGTGRFPAGSYPNLERNWLTNQMRKHLLGVSSPPPVTDDIPPAVTLTWPSGGATLTGTVTLGATASDNVGVTEVRFSVDGNLIGSPVTTGPYTRSWNSAAVANGTHTITATARDAAGNSSSSLAAVAVLNSVPASADLWIYRESLAQPWISTPWSATVAFGSTEQEYAGTNAVKVIQSAWGSVSFHSGSWYAPVAVNTSLYSALEFAVYGGASGVTMAVMLENDAGDAFPAVSGGPVAANTWKFVSIPVSMLNPGGLNVHRVDIMEKSGVLKTYFLDEIRFRGNTGVLPPPPAPDTVRPVVAVTSPAAGATLTGTVTLDATASDNVRVTELRFSVDGNLIGSPVTTPPYTRSWNSAAVANGTHTVTATARDSAGNSASSSLSVTVSNPVTVTSDLWIYRESLAQPWISTPWSATVTLGSTEQQYAGTNAVKAVQSAWGSVSFHSGSWYAPVAVNTSLYSVLEFAVHGGASGVTMAVMLENDAGDAFPAVSGGPVAANTWKVVSIPVSKLNPGGLDVHRVDIMEKSGVLKTYFLDEIRFTGSAPATASARPDAPAADEVPAEYSLAQNFPNPFNPTTTIGYALPVDAEVTLGIYDAIGRSVRTIAAGRQAAGYHEARFDASGLPSGTYFYRLTAIGEGAGAGGPFVGMKKMILLK